MRGTPINRLEQTWSTRSAEDQSPEGIANKAREWQSSAETYIRSHPQVALAAAAVAGLLLGWMIKRR